MKNAYLKRIGSELDTIVRLKEIDEDKLTNELIAWLDYEYHGIVNPQFDFDQRNVVADRPLAGDMAAGSVFDTGSKNVPDKKPKAGT